MKTLATLLTVAAAIALPGAAEAAVIFNINQVGKDIVVTGAGTINTTGLTAGRSAIQGRVLDGLPASVPVGPAAQTTLYSNAFTNSLSFSDTQFAISPTSGTGDTFGIAGRSRILYLPVGYVSGSALAGSATITNRTLNYNLGTYVFNIANGDSVTVNIGPVAAVPEPATWAMMLLGYGAIGGAARYRRRKTNVAFA